MSSVKVQKENGTVDRRENKCNRTRVLNELLRNTETWLMSYGDSLHEIHSRFYDSFYVA